MNELIQRLSEAIPSEAMPWLTKVAAAMQRVQTERLWYVLIAIIIVSFGWVLGREVIRRLAGPAGKLMAHESMALHPKSGWGTTDTERQDLDFARDAEAVCMLRRRAPQLGS
jgi:hypothetical protein